MTARRRFHIVMMGVGCLSVAGLVGCGLTTAAAASRPMIGVHGAPPKTLQWIGEPQSGFRSWQTALARARTGVLVNQYLLTDTTYAQALIHIAQGGIPVRVILAANPYHDAAAVGEERQLFAGTPVQLHWATGRFDQPYATDHAKYVVVNPGTSQALAILGSPNGTESAFGGWNAEDALATTSPAITGALTAVFHADWTGHPAGLAPRRVLILSPGAEPALLRALTGPGPVAVATEELGDVPALYAALAKHGAQARLLVPPDALMTAEGEKIARQLVVDGVQIRTLAKPYMHAKLMVTADQTVIGSQNWSEPSMTNNREVGLALPTRRLHRQALQWFNRLWQTARPWH